MAAETLISDELRWTADQIVNHLDYRSAVLSGLAPDSSHLESGGFHCSILVLIAHGNGNDFSNTRAGDKGFNPSYGAAFDVSLSPADMIKAYGRVHAVWADKADPRRVYVNAINGWDGSGDAVRLDFDANVAKYASPDHKWHNHGEIHRRFVRDPKAARAVVSMFKGEPKAAWIAREEPTTAQGDIMDWTDKFATPSWTPERFGKNPPSYGTALILAAINGRDTLSATVANGTAIAHLAQAVAAKDSVDEQALGQAIAAAITPAILAALPAGTLTETQVEDAVRNVLRAGVGAA